MGHATSEECARIVCGVVVSEAMNLVIVLVVLAFVWGGIYFIQRYTG